MMPPHIKDIDPLPGNSLTTGAITVFGYSLRYAAPPEVVDESDGSVVETRVDIDVKQVGRGVGDPHAPAGSIQEETVLRVIIPGFRAGHAYRLSFCDGVFRYPAPQP